MKVEQFSDSNIQTFGDIEKNKVGIDRENIDFITTLLTSNLYSHPLSSFLRETVSNAYDSHREAGTDSPILILVKGKDDSFSSRNIVCDISVRDYGVGISPERFQNIYTNIGSSTKRESNTYIGGWGIGRFAALAVSSNVIINSYYNGVKYSYLMYKDGSSISIDKISSQVEDPGEFKQGVEVIATKVNITKEMLKEALLQIALFENLHVEYVGSVYSAISSLISDFNARRITEYNNFYVMEGALLPVGYFVTKNVVAVGNVSYDLDTGSDVIHRAAELSSLNKLNTCIIFKCAIGDVHVTPNREALRYSDKTKAALNNCVLATHREIKSLMEKIDMDLPDVGELACLLYGTKRVALDKHIEERYPDLLNFGEIKISMQGKPIPPILLRAIRLSEYTDVKVDKLSTTTLSTSRATIHMKKLLQGRLWLKRAPRLKRVTYRYITDGYLPRREENYIFTEDAYLMLIRRLASLCSDCSEQEKLDLETLLFLFLKTGDITNEMVPDDFIEKRKETAERKKKLRSILQKDCELRRYHRNGGYWKSSLGNIGGLIVYAQNTKEDDLIKKLATWHRGSITFVTLKKEDLSSISPNNRKFVSLYDFMHQKNKFWRNFFTNVYIREQYTDNPLPDTPSMLYSCKVMRLKNLLREACVLSSLPAEVVALYNKYVENKWLDYMKIQEFTITDREKEVWDMIYLADRTSATHVLVASGVIKKEEFRSSGKCISNSDLKKGRKMFNLIKQKL